MKARLILAAYWLLCFRLAQAQEPKALLIIYMADTSLIEIRDTVGDILDLYSSNSDIQNILNNYEIYGFQKAYPMSRFPDIHNYYMIHADSVGLLHQLLTYNQELFPLGYEEKYEYTYTPNDYGAYGPFPLTANSGDEPGTTGQPEMDYIGAKTAWDITHGSPDVVIGIVDSYFDLTHPELSGKIAQVRANTLPGSHWAHGTMTGGLIAAATDNNTGIAAIGFDCRLDVSNVNGALLAKNTEMLNMSNSGRRILNGSWITGSDCAGNFGQLHDAFIMQGTYNEVYENGTIPFFGAGNYANQACGLDGYAYPASLDHCMSITSVGCEFPIGTMTTDIVGSDLGTPLLGGYNWKGVHKINADLPESHPKSSFHHNDRVDLAAPGYYIKTLDFDPADPGWNYAWGPMRFSSGTSFSSPITAGTAGLMLSVNGCLSPYQIEYILKTTADASIYSISENATYIGLLGAGALRADLAVAAAAAPDACNNPDTRTFGIKGVEINTVCAPGFSSNGVKPKLTPILEHGTPPYTYKWEALPGNTTTLDAYNIAEPSVISAAPTSVYPERTAFYRLTIYDSSPIQKVANKNVRITLKTTGYDLAMRDLDMDMLDEPNTMSTYDPRTWNVWKSPDIWNRWAEDDERVHQQPEFFTSNPNYLYVKVRNVGCEPAPGGKRLKLYWSVASTTEHWSSDWDGTATFPGSSLPLGGLITSSSGLDIPGIAPGSSTILHNDWIPPKPSDYYPAANRIETCLLARIEESTSAPYGMAITEISNAPVYVNVINNNNIVTHNTFSTNLAPGNLTRDAFMVLIGNSTFYTHTDYTLQLINEKEIHKHHAGDISAVIRTKVHLGDQLYARWAAGGYTGTYAQKDNVAKTVTFDGMNMELQKIELKSGELFPVKIEVELIDNAPVTDYSYTLHFRQINENPGTRDPITGNVSFEIFTEEGIWQPIMKKTTISNSNQYNVYPNPAKDKVNIEYLGKDKKALIEILDIMGRTLYSEQAILNYSPKSIPLTNFPSGLYLILVKDEAGQVEQFKITKD